MSDVGRPMQTSARLVDEASQENGSRRSCAKRASPDGTLMYTFEDGLHGPIHVGPREATLLNTPTFVRLQEVKQRGFVHRIWPGAVHTRYEQSLGCYHLY